MRVAEQYSVNSIGSTQLKLNRVRDTGYGSGTRTVLQEKSIYRIWLDGAYSRRGVTEPTSKRRMLPRTERLLGGRISSFALTRSTCS